MSINKEISFVDYDLLIDQEVKPQRTEKPYQTLTFCQNSTINSVQCKHVDCLENGFNCFCVWVCVCVCVCVWGGGGGGGEREREREKGKRQQDHYGPILLT